MGLVLYGLRYLTHIVVSASNSGQSRKNGEDGQISNFPVTGIPLIPLLLVTV